MIPIVSKSLSEYIQEEFGQDFLHGLLIGLGLVEVSGLTRELISGIQASSMYEHFAKELEKELLCDFMKSQLTVGQTVLYKRFLHNDEVLVTVVKVHESDKVTVNFEGRNFSVKASNLRLKEEQ
jgi:hypothetical protein